MADDSPDVAALRKSFAEEIKKEIFRKAIHLLCAIVPTLLAVWYLPTVALLVAAVAVYSLCELLRLKGIKVPIVSLVTEIASRKRDGHRFVAGPVTLVLGILLAAVFLVPVAARIGIYALAFGDGLASLVGKLVPSKKIPFTGGKSVAGSLACFLAVLASAFLVCQNPVSALILALLGMIIEVLPLRDFDNLLIPIAIGAVFQFALLPHLFI